MTQEHEALISALEAQDAFKDPATSRLLGTIVALGGEVFVLKAQVERLTRALQAAGVVDDAALARVGEDKTMSAWIASEERQFGETLLRPFLQPDLVKNVAAMMRDDTAIEPAQVKK